MRLLSFLCAALAATAGAAPGQAQAPEREVPLVKVLHEDRSEVVGYGLPSSPDHEGLVMVSENGLLIDVPWTLVKDVATLGARKVSQVPPDALVQGLAHADRRTREECYDWLADQGARSAEAVVTGTRLPSAEGRRLALKLLSRIRDPQHGAVARRCLRDKEFTVRRQALHLYALLEPADLVSTCLDVLHGDRHPVLRHDAIVILGDAGDVTCVDSLLRHLEDSDDRSLALVTFVALKKLTGKDFGREEWQWRAWWTNHRDKVLEEAEQRRRRS